MGVKVETNMVIGQHHHHRRADGGVRLRGRVHRLRRGSAACSWTSPARTCKGVYSANEFLTRINLMKAYQRGQRHPHHGRGGKTVAVVGGGNVAMDAARCAKRLGAERSTSSTAAAWRSCPPVTRRSSTPMEEGIIFKTLNNPVEILGDENGHGVQVRHDAACEMELGEPDASGRRRPVEMEGSEFDAAMWTRVIMALGTSPNPLIKIHHQGSGGQQEGRHHRQRGRPDLPRGRLCRRRRRHRRRHRHLWPWAPASCGAKAIDEYLQKK